MKKGQLTEKLHEIVSDPAHPLAAASVGIIKKGKIIFAGTSGFKRKEGNIQADSDTKFRMASISKLLTATGIWQQVEKGTLNADQDVSDYLGFPLRNPHHPETVITLRHLLSHTSSIREGDDSDRVVYVLPFGASVRDYFDPQKPAYYDGCWAPPEEKPGEYYAYTNFNYGLLGTVLERVSNERFDQYMKRHIFQPLGLDCGFYLPSMTQEAREHVGTLYRKLRKDGTRAPDGEWVPQCDDKPELCSEDSYEDYVPGENATLFSPQGGLRASLNDMLRLMQMWMHGDGILKPETICKMFAPFWKYDGSNGDGSFDLAYACGPQIFTDTPGVDCFVKDKKFSLKGHSAGAYGLTGVLGMDLEQENGVIAVAAGSSTDHYPGTYSAFDGWREEMLSAGYDFFREYP